MKIELDSLRNKQAEYKKASSFCKSVKNDLIKSDIAELLSKRWNKPLDEIAKKMIQYANLYDDFKDAYYNIKRNNLGVQETYKKMLEYWNLHHQDKTKGKRLTIKEV